MTLPTQPQPTNHPLAIGIDFGGTSIKLAVVRGGEIVERGNSLDTREIGSAEGILDAMVGEIARLKAAYPEIVAVGAGLPGLVDAAKGFVHELTNVPGWYDVPLRDILAERTGLVAAIDNDAKAMTYAEWRFGAANNQPNVICVTLGTGVGGGLILGGQLHRGGKNSAGEIGQTSINIHGVPAHYGNSGALEKYVGNRQIAERAQLRYSEAGIKRTEDECSPAALSIAAAAGDAVAKAVWNEIGTEIGASLANLVWLLNPDCIVIGGGVARAGEVLFEPIRAAVRGRCMDILTDDLDIVPATLGSDAGVIGAAALGVASVQARA
jgi:glucokinase